MVRYPAILDGKRGAYGVVVPDIGACAMGETVDEALAHAEECLADMVELMIQDGETVPSPSDPESVVLEDGQLLAYVPLRSTIAA